MKEDLVPMEQEPDIPVYLFTGFMDAGKTKFIQETLEDKRFDTGERTLLIVCEEGEEEYAPDQFAGKKVMIRLAEDEGEFTEDLLYQWQVDTGAERVLIEWNGMWMLDTLYQAMPPRWVVAQEFMFAEAESFLLYNTNMRQLVYDKLKSCELVVFNRFDPKQDIMPFHKVVRAANRSCDIAYEDAQGKVRYDDIEDPLPFDKNAPVIDVADRDYALWYRDLNEELQSYHGKTVHFKAQGRRHRHRRAAADELLRRRHHLCRDDRRGQPAARPRRRRLGGADRLDPREKARGLYAPRPGADHPGDRPGGAPGGRGCDLLLSVQKNYILMIRLGGNNDGAKETPCHPQRF